MRQHASSERIKDLPAKSLVAKVANVLKEICLTTGLKVDDGTATEFTKMFNRFLLTHYGMLTPGEVSLAFTLNAAGELPGDNGKVFTDRIELYGPNLTIEHVGGVLYRYMQKRAKLASKITKQQHLQIEEPKPTKEEIEMNNKEFANEYYRKYLNKEFSSASIEYAHLVYDVLDSFKVIQLSTEDKQRIFKEAQSIRDKELSAPPASREEKRERLALIDSYLSDAVPVHEQNYVKAYAKRLALLEAFAKWKETGKTKIFDI